MVDGMNLRRAVLFAAVGAVTMGVLLPCLALVRDTTAHDWYSARKLTLTQAMLAVGFDPYKATVYRTPDGTTMRIHRFAFVVYGEPIRARAHILTTVGDHAVLGAIAGAIGAALCVVVLVGARWSRHHRSGMPATAAAPGPPVHRATWSRSGSVENVSRHDGGGSRIGLLVVAPAQIEDTVEVYGPVEIRGPLPVGQIVQDGAGWEENASRSVQRADAPAMKTMLALPAAAPPGAAAQPGPAKADVDAPAAPGSRPKAVTQVGRTPRGRTRTPGKDPTVDGDGAGVREARTPARPKPGKGGSGHWV